MNNILIGDVIEQLKNLADESVYCVVTSPPYYGLRDYGEAGQIGQEDTPEQYVAKLVEVFREVRRVLHPTGTLWLNLGDSYIGSWGNYGGQNRGNGSQREITTGSKINHKAYEGKEKWRPATANPQTLKPKNLAGIPWRVALALQADGWYLRSDIIWHKPNCLPESVTDRPTKAHEYVFLLSKSPQYWYDQEAVREPHSRDWHNETVGPEYMTPQQGRNDGGKMKGNGSTSGRNKRTVWTIPTKPFRGAHFAVMPEELAETCIKGGCPPMVCVECGQPWVRVVERDGSTWDDRKEAGAPMRYGLNSSKKTPKNRYGDIATKTLHFAPTCQCCPLPARKQATAPGLVLDPFFGAGTVGVVAEKLHRRWLGIELNPAYVELARERLERTQPGLPIIF